MGGAIADHTQSAAALEQNAAIILDSLDYGVLAIDAEKQIVFVNRIAEGILQLAREELLGHRLDEVLKTPRNSLWLATIPSRGHRDSSGPAGEGRNPSASGADDPLRDRAGSGGSAISPRRGRFRGDARARMGVPCEL